MKKTNFAFPLSMLARLQAAKLQLEVPLSEIVRRAVEEFLQKMGL